MRVLEAREYRPARRRSAQRPGERGDERGDRLWIGGGEDLLQVRPGDRLQVEFLEGHRRTLTVPVAGTVQEYLGVGAYARHAFVNSMLNEGDVASGAWLSVDARHRDAVLAELKASGLRGLGGAHLQGLRGGNHHPWGKSRPAQTRSAGVSS